MFHFMSKKRFGMSGLYWLPKSNCNILSLTFHYLTVSLELMIIVLFVALYMLSTLGCNDAMPQNNLVLTKHSIREWPQAYSKNRGRCIGCTKGACLIVDDLPSADNLIADRDYDSLRACWGYSSQYHLNYRVHRKALLKSNIIFFIRTF